MILLIVIVHVLHPPPPFIPLAIVTLPLMRIFPLQVSESVPEEVRKWLASTFAKQEQVHVGDGHGQVMNDDHIYDHGDDKKAGG